MVSINSNLCSEFSGKSQYYEGLFSNVKVQETFAQNPGRRLVYARNKDQFSMKFLQVRAINDDRVFILSYVAEEVKYALFLPQVETMIKSFEII